MNQKRTRIIDIAEELGVSTATVSNVIHGKTKKISDETVRRVQELLEEREYIPSMAGILLAQNDSRIIGVVVNDHEKYESHVLEDAFIASSLNYLSAEIEKAGYFMMVKTTTKWDEIVRFASMWNLEGMVVIGFCEQDYQKVRDAIRIPFVVYDGYFEAPRRICNLTIDHYNGGFQVGEHFRKLGHRRVLCVSDNQICMDLERYEGFCEGFCGFQGKKKMTKQSSEEDGRYHARESIDRIADFMQVPMNHEERRRFYEEQLESLKGYTAVFAVSDYYAIDLMRFLQGHGVRIPEDISIAGFDDVPLCKMVLPSLTTVKQDGKQRARLAIAKLQELKEGAEEGGTVRLPVMLAVRQSTRAKDC